VNNAYDAYPMISLELFRAELENRLSAELNVTTRILKSSPVGGGCINHCYKIETIAGDFFLKYNFAEKYPGMFAAEARGLELLRSASALRIPEVILQFESGKFSFLVLEFLGNGKRRENFWKEFGSGLAKIHRQSAAKFGLDHDNYIGSLVQSNRMHDRWSTFYNEERLQAQLALAVNHQRISEKSVRSFEKIFSRLEELIPVESPALLHGDLWNGNFLNGPSGEACLLDPAVYFGHREMDLAMSRLFGGFDPEFYEAYQDVFPLQPGSDERIPLMQLYPLLVHVNLFGGSYVQQVEDILKKFME